MAKSLVLGIKMTVYVLDFDIYKVIWHIRSRTWPKVVQSEAKSRDVKYGRSPKSGRCVFTPLKSKNLYHIWYVRKARSLSFNLAPKFCVWDFSIKSYDFLKKSCQKAPPKVFGGRYISVPIGIDFSVLKWVYILITFTKKNWGWFIKKLKSYKLIW